MFIKEVKGLIDFASEFSKLNELLADPKNLKSSIKELEDAEAIIARRDEVLAAEKKNEEDRVKLDEELLDLQTKATAAAAALSDAEAAMNIAIKAKTDAERDVKKVADVLKEVEALKADNDLLYKQNIAKSKKLDDDLAAVETLKLELQAAIDSYKDGLEKLSQVKVP